MIIDAHNHPCWLGHDVEKSLQDMDRLGIEKCWILSWECPRNEYSPNYYKEALATIYPQEPMPFTLCLDYKRRAPERFILGYAPDPRLPEAMDLLKAAIDMYDVQVYGELKLRMMFDNPDAIEMYRFCGKEGLPVVFHLDYPVPAGESRYPRANYWYSGSLEAVERGLAACPETDFLGHAPGFWAHISGDDGYLMGGYPTGAVAPGGRLQQALDTYPNLYCDISANSGLNALKRDPAHALKFIHKYQDRLVYGRDWWGTNGHQEFLNGLGLEPEILEKIYCKNSIKLLKRGR